MRILVIHNRYQQAGGEDAVAENESRLLADRGHEVRLATRSNSEIAGLAGQIQAMRSVAYSTTGRDWAASHIAEFRPDVVHVHNFFPLISPAVFDATRKAGVPSVLTLHNFRITCAGGMLLRDGRPCEKCLAGSPGWGVVHRCYRGSFAGSAAVAHMIRRHRRQNTWARSVDRIAVLSEFSRRKFIEAGIPAHKMRVKPNFLAEDPGAGDGSGGHVLFLGRLGPEKGIAVLTQAWERTSGDSRLIIAGDGPLRQEVERWANGRSNVSYVGWVERPQATELLKSARALVLPSLVYEMHPVTLVEAFASGVPVIVTRHGSLAELVEDGRSGFLVAPGDPVQLAQAIERLAGETPLWPERSSAARQAYLDRFTADCGYRDLMALYETVT